MYGYADYAKDKENNPKGFVFEVIWEARNETLRIFTDKKYQYLNAEQATKLLGLIIRAMQKTMEKSAKK